MNKKYEPLKIVRTSDGVRNDRYVEVIMEMMRCNAMLVRAGKDSAMPHYIACVKELEDIIDIRFEKLDQ